MIIQASNEGVPKDLGGVQGGAFGAVVDLVATGSAGSGDDVILVGFADGGEEDEFTNLIGDFEVLLFVAEGAGHAAATAGDGFDGVVGREGEGGFGGGGAGEGFSETVAVEVDGFGLVLRRVQFQRGESFR